MTTLELQTALLDAGFDPGPLDGRPGALTITALEKFQAAKGLQPDGVLGPLTQEALLGNNPPILGMSAASMLSLWTTTVVKPEDVTVSHRVASQVKSNSDRYSLVAASFPGMPWYVPGLIHSLEAGFNFQTHLANGDPLFDKEGNGLKTVHVPAGLGPFKTWEEGAIAAFRHEGWKGGMSWDVGNLLMHLRAYNGTGYEGAHSVNTPYLWSMTNHYVTGMYIADGEFSLARVSEEVGAAAIMLGLQASGFKI